MSLPNSGTVFFMHAGPELCGGGGDSAATLHRTSPVPHVSFSLCDSFVPAFKTVAR